MGFWGIEVKPGKPYTYQFDDVPGKLHVTQATLGDGLSKKKCVVQCSVGDMTPVFLCSFLPDKIETCPLNLQFEKNDSVTFSVIGTQSVHLSGFVKADEQTYTEDDYESDSFGEDITETNSDESSDYDSENEFEDNFIDDDGFGFPPSSVPNSGVVIEEILEDEKPSNAKSKSKQSKKKKQVSESNGNNNSQKQIVVKSASAAIVVESEDEDGFPVPSTHNGKPNTETVKAYTEEKILQKATTETKKKRGRDDSDNVESSEGKVANMGSKLESDDFKNKNKKKKQKQQSANGNAEEEDDVPTVKNEQEKELTNDKKMDVNSEHVSIENLSAEKKKKKTKKKKGKTQDSGVDEDTNTITGKDVTSTGDASKSTLVLEEKKDKSKASQVRTFPNGLVIEELKMGKPDGKRASPGSKVSVHYIGKLKKNGSIFDSNIGRAPFKFRLGVGQVIKGWDVGVKGMRVGDKRRLTIPPDMGYGTKGAGKKIPPNSWLVFEVDLAAVG